MADVLIVGAGPVGLTLACELARHGARCRIVDGAAQPSPYCRAIGVTPRTLEVWEDMGLAREMIDAGLWLTGLRTVLYGQPPVDALSPPLDLPYASLGLPQSETERVLTRHLERCGLRVERGLELAVVAQQRRRQRLERLGGTGGETGGMAADFGRDGADACGVGVGLQPTLGAGPVHQLLARQGHGDGGRADVGQEHALDLRAAGRAGEEILGDRRLLLETHGGRQHVLADRQQLLLAQVRHRRHLNQAVALLLRLHGSMLLIVLR